MYLGQIIEIVSTQSTFTNISASDTEFYTAKPGFLRYFIKLKKKISLLIANFIRKIFSGISIPGRKL